MAAAVISVLGVVSSEAKNLDGAASTSAALLFTASLAAIEHSMHTKTSFMCSNFNRFDIGSDLQLSYAKMGRAQT